MNTWLKSIGMLFLAAQFIPMLADDAPTVTTDTRFARGATRAFGRAKFAVVNGNTIQTRGFCWSSETRTPTLENEHSNLTYSNHGLIFRMENLSPATVYYARAYAIGKDGAVGYGNVIKIVTLPKGAISWGYDNGGDDAANARISAAVENSVNYWNDLTSISNLYLNVHYGASTPTADCSYGGWMRVGPNSSYQKEGTIMHEALHAIGVGTTGLWYDTSSPLRGGSGTGAWLGDRTNELMQFWDNSTTEYATGDKTHIWATGSSSSMTSFSVNGANEDTGTDMQYTAVSLLAQAVGEDGLPPTSSRAFGSPYYSFNQEDTIKYYLKNESETYGLFSSFLVETDNHQLQWQKMTAEEAIANDAAAWYLTFTPGNQYYQLRNAQTGYRITYTSTGFVTTSTTTVTSNQNLQLMRSRIDITNNAGDVVTTQRGYWLLHPDNSSANPPALTAASNQAVSIASFSLENTATNQRWVILTADEAVAMDDAGLLAARADYLKNKAIVEDWFATGHSELETEADQRLTEKLNEFQTVYNQSTVADEIAVLADSVLQQGKDWLGRVCVSDTLTPFNLTALITNAGFDSDCEGWGMSSSATWGSGTVEFYETAPSCTQKFAGMPKGTYSVKLQGFQRPGSYANVYSAYTSGTNSVNARLYIGNFLTYALLHNIMDQRSATSLHSADKEMADGTFIPNTMASAAAHFEAGYYENEYRKYNTSAGSFYIGLQGSTNTSYWTIFDNFRLYYYGPVQLSDWVSGLEEVKLPETPAAQTYFDLLGRPVSQPSQGIFIKNGKKIILR